MRPPALLPVRTLKLIIPALSSRFGKNKRVPPSLLPCRISQRMGEKRCARKINLRKDGNVRNVREHPETPVNPHRWVRENVVLSARFSQEC